jgi:hypothetical protein
MLLNPTKSIIGVSAGKLLEHIVLDSSISIDLERVIAIQNIQAPSSKKEIQSFMGIRSISSKFC